MMLNAPMCEMMSFSRTTVKRGREKKNIGNGKKSCVGRNEIVKKQNKTKQQKQLSLLRIFYPKFVPLTNNCTASFLLKKCLRNSVPISNRKYHTPMETTLLK